MTVESPRPETMAESDQPTGLPRLLHVVGDSAFGGGGRIIIALAVAARRAGYRVEVLTTDGTFQRALADKAIQCVHVDVIGRAIRPARDLRGLLALRRFLAGRRYDIVHTHTTKAGIVGRAAAHLAGVRVVVHSMHGYAYHDGTRTVLKRAATVAERLAAKWCDAVVPVGDYLAASLASDGVVEPAKLLAIPNGIPDILALRSRSREEVRQEFSLPDDAMLLVCHGRLSPGKGLDTLMAGVALLRDRGLRATVLVVGDGPLRSCLEQRSAALGLAEQVVFTGYRDDVADLVCAADLVVLPSHREGLSIAVLEAMSAGAAIVTTSIPANLEATAGDTALLVPAGDPDALASAVEQLVKHPDQGRMLGRRARMRYETTYRQDTMTSAYLALYERLLR